MTKNQIEFLKYQESLRANQANEMLTRNRDLNTYLLGSRNAAEQERANRAKEALTAKDLAQQLRRNEQNYEVSRLSLDETSRHNLAMEGETQRSNQAREDETRRSNLAREGLTLQELVERERYNRATETLGYANLYESQRAHLAQESETHRTNVAREQISMQQAAEQARSNRANESLRGREINLRGEELRSLNDYRSQQIDLSHKSQILESARLDEQIRSNVAREIETQRSNLAQEALSMQKLDDYYELESRRLDEIERSHQAQESIDRFAAANKASNDAFRYVVPLILGGM